MEYMEFQWRWTFSALGESVIAACHDFCGIYSPTVHNWTRPMPPSLTFDDFEIMSQTCELRYDNAFLIFDRTGQIIYDLQKFVPNIGTVNATPPQTTFGVDGGVFVLELGACRFGSTQAKRKLEAFIEYCKVFFDAVTSQLRIDVFKRVGLRHVMKRDFGSEAEAKSALAAMQITNLKPIKRFNISDKPSEILLRWEDAEIGVTVRLKAEVGNEPRPSEQKEDAQDTKKTPRLILDVDYYTVAPVEIEQWNTQEWITQKVRMIRKEVDSLLL
jgi:uncharacterized protein (TIGR04255 family)